MNRAELLALYAWAKANPDEHDQSGYARRSPSCGTAYCVAAMACVRAGDRLLWSGSGAQWAHYIEAPLTVGGVNSPRGPAIHTRAAELLGLDEGQADALFDANNDLADLRKWIWAITGIDPEAGPAEPLGAVQIVMPGDELPAGLDLSRPVWFVSPPPDLDAEPVDISGWRDLGYVDETGGDRG